MPCFRPKPVWVSAGGELHIKERPSAGARRIHIPCTKCSGCRKDWSKGWSLRCILEATKHAHNIFVTLTYEDDPESISKRTLQLFFKRLRKAIGPFRYFAAGEYGERQARPHYHILFFGVALSEADTIEAVWRGFRGHGHIQAETATDRAISYVAGYVSKKYNDGRSYTGREKPFVLMSRGGKGGEGIGGNARQWPASWRNVAILNGGKMRVPRYLHEAWREQATEEQIEQHQYETGQAIAEQDRSPERLAAAEAKQNAKDRIAAERRRTF